MTRPLNWLWNLLGFSQANFVQEERRGIDLLHVVAGSNDPKAQIDATKGFIQETKVEEGLESKRFAQRQKLIGHFALVLKEFDAIKDIEGKLAPWEDEQRRLTLNMLNKQLQTLNIEHKEVEALAHVEEEGRALLEIEEKEAKTTDENEHNKLEAEKKNLIKKEEQLEFEFMKDLELEKK